MYLQVHLSEKCAKTCFRDIYGWDSTKMHVSSWTLYLGHKLNTSFDLILFLAELRDFQNLITRVKILSQNIKESEYKKYHFFGIFQSNWQCQFNSQAVGLDFWSALKSIFSGDSIFESAAWFFVIILKFIFKSIFGIKIHGKIPWHQKNHFRRPIFNNHQIFK